MALIPWQSHNLGRQGFLCLPAILIGIAGLMAGASQAATGDESRWLCDFQFENDFFGGNTDHHYTHGTRIGCLSRRLHWFETLADQLPWFSLAKAQAPERNQLKARARITLGQNIYTPENLSATTLVKEDRPYAGWLYLGFGLVGNQGNSRYDKIELEIGVVGPASGAEDVQTTWHRWFGFRHPNGWHHQLKNEPGLNLYYEQARRQSPLNLGASRLKLQLTPHFGFALGNVFTYAAGGMTVRIGKQLEQDFGPPRIRPSLAGSGLYRYHSDFNWYLFAGLEGRAVARNIFLDGNSFQDSHSVDRKLLVGDLQAGLVMQYGDLRVAYTQIFRTREYQGQDHPDRFGALNISWLF